MSTYSSTTSLPENQETKACSKCGVVYPATADYFYRNKSVSNGLQCACKKCRCLDAKKWQHENRDKCSGYMKKSMEKRAERDKGIRVCKKCKRRLPANLEFFSIDPSRKSGLKWWCKDCVISEFGSKKKICTKCGEEKQRTEEFFNKLPKSKDGFNYQCKECISAKAKHMRRSAIKKVCRACKKEKPNTIEFFNKHKVTVDGLGFICRSCDEILKKTKVCSKCKKEKPRTVKFFSRAAARNDGFNCQCKDCINGNKDRITKKKDYYQINKKRISVQGKKYRDANKEEVSIRHKKYDNSKFRASSTSILKEFSTYEETLKINGKHIQVDCAYCGKPVFPTNRQVKARVFAARQINAGESRIYCNDNNNSCKQACPTYHKHKYPSGYRKATSREVDPWVRQLCFSRDAYTCQKCGVTIKDAQLHCHHIEGYAQNKMLGNDVTNTITYCKSCHKDVHKKPGCGYHELRNEKFECT